MKNTVGAIFAIAQTIIGTLILTDHATLRTYAWYMVITGGLTVTALVVAALVLISKRES